jgi:hypothetical protein
MSRPCGTQGTCLPLERSHPISFVCVCVCAGGQTVGATCESTETNPCVSAPPIVPNAKKAPTMFALKINQNVFVQCEGLKPNVRFCQFPLKFSFVKQMCDWNKLSTHTKRVKFYLFTFIFLNLLQSCYSLF